MCNETRPETCLDRFSTSSHSKTRHHSSIRVSADLVHCQIQSDTIIYVQIYNTVYIYIYIYMYFCICIIIPWTRWWVPREPQTLDFNLRFLASWFSMHYKNSPWMRALLVYWDIGTVKHALLIATVYVCIRLNTFLKCKFGNYSVFEDFKGQILSLITAIHDISWPSCKTDRLHQQTSIMAKHQPTDLSHQGNQGLPAGVVVCSFNVHSCWWNHSQTPSKSPSLSMFNG
jgi:hypothetical protein